MLTIFEYSTWLLVCVLFVLCAITWYILGRATSEQIAHRKLDLCFFNTFGMMMSVTVNNRPYLSPLRIFFVTIALYDINLATIYTSKLINVFTNPPYDDQIDTIEEIVDSRLPIGKLMNIWSKFIQCIEITIFKFKLKY